MGVKVLKCFPWFDRRKERAKLTKSKSLEAPEPPKSPVEPPVEKTRVRSTPSSSSDDGQQARAYFSGKARVSFRHEMDSTMSVNDSTF
ncbi:uncharacterized protein C17orf114 homolog [Ambystoma mexicanum]|uniref:uncharacterized protein C17orf114 homolog n=1 Tax=Ambystoma mexicanum TaxID=8296 RepID=UPI0037E88FD5